MQYEIHIHYIHIGRNCYMTWNEVDVSEKSLGSIKVGVIDCQFSAYILDCRVYSILFIFLPSKTSQFARSSDFTHDLPNIDISTQMEPKMNL